MFPYDLFIYQTFSRKLPTVIYADLTSWKHAVTYIRVGDSNLAALVEGDPKASFSIATTPKCRGGRYSFPWIAPLYPWSIPYNAEC